MSGGTLEPVLAGLGLGVALAGAPGPVQAVLLAESVRGGTRRGFRALAGANLTLAVLLACLAFGLSVEAPAGLALALLQVAGGALLLLLAADGLRSATSPARGPDRHTGPDGHSEPDGHSGPGGLAGLARARRARALSPVPRGVLAVLLNPGMWLFLGAVAAPLLASAVKRGGTGIAVVVALVTVLGCSGGDTAVVLAGGIGVRRAGQRAQVWAQRVLAVALAGLGCWFLGTGISSLSG